MDLISTLSKTQKKYIQYRDFKENTVIFHENDICNNVGIVIKGEIAIISYLENGKEIVYNVIKDNGIFGANLIFSSKPYYKGNVICEKQSKIALINKENIIKIIQNNKEFALEFLKAQANFAIGLNETIELLSIEKAEDRLLYYFHNNHNTINYQSVSQLAKKLHLQRETLSRLLSKYEKKNKIKREKNTISLL